MKCRGSLSRTYDAGDWRDTLIINMMILVYKMTDICYHTKVPLRSASTIHLMPASPSYEILSSCSVGWSIGGSDEDWCICKHARYHGNSHDARVTLAYHYALFDIIIHAEMGASVFTKRAHAYRRIAGFANLRKRRKGLRLMTLFHAWSKIGLYAAA